MSGYLQKLHKAKKWKKMWFVLKDKVLYQFKATQVTISLYYNNSFLCPQRNFGRHIVIALSIRPSVSPSVRQSVRPAFVSGPYLLYSLR